MAAGAEVGAAAGYDGATYFCSAAKALFAGALVDAVAELKLATPTVGIHIIGNGRAAQANCFQEHSADGSMEIAKLAGLECGSQMRRMNARSPEAFVRVDVAHSSQDSLVEQERFYAGAAPTQFRGEFLFGGLKRIEAEFAQSGFVLAILDDSHASEAANVGVAQLTSVVEREKDVGVRDYRSFGWTDDELPRHSQMNQQSGAGVIGARGLEIEHKKFAVPSNCDDATTGEALLEGGRIVDEIRFAEANAEDSSSGERGSQAARNGFYLREFGHGRDWTLAHRTEMLNPTRRKANGRAEAPSERPVCEKNFVVDDWGVC